jgi:hypothetical protein
MVRLVRFCIGFVVALEVLDSHALFGAIHNNIIMKRQHIMNLSMAFPVIVERKGIENKRSFRRRKEDKSFCSCLSFRRHKHMKG